ncbi:hypothetical protein NC652_009599 [Populus alba x Populus x berolinensis]|nr:hypothetical protein NC652_009599 [Populus alba x Populus x berolinensis]
MIMTCLAPHESTKTTEIKGAIISSSCHRVLGMVTLNSLGYNHILLWTNTHNYVFQRQMISTNAQAYSSWVLKRVPSCSCLSDEHMMPKKDRNINLSQKHLHIQLETRKAKSTHLRF